MAAWIFGAYFLSSCTYQIPTPDKYKYIDTVSKVQYERNKAELMDSIKVLIKTKGGPYYPDENDSSTGIFVDTILYSPNKEKYASFIITKNSNAKLLDKGKPNEYHYNADGFIGRLDRNLDIKDLSWINAYSFILNKSLNEASYGIREMFFKEITTRKDLGGESIFKNNLDDIRFWDGPLWHEYYK